MAESFLVDINKRYACNQGPHVFRIRLTYPAFELLLLMILYVTGEHLHRDNCTCMK